MGSSPTSGSSAGGLLLPLPLPLLVFPLSLAIALCQINRVLKNKNKNKPKQNTPNIGPAPGSTHPLQRQHPGSGPSRSLPKNLPGRRRLQRPFVTNAASTSRSAASSSRSRSQAQPPPFFHSSSPADWLAESCTAAAFPLSWQSLPRTTPPLPQPPKQDGGSRAGGSKESFGPAGVALDSESRYDVGSACATYYSGCRKEEHKSIWWLRPVKWV